MFPFLLGVLRDADQETQRAGDEPPIEPLIDAWLQHCAIRTHSAPTLRTYADRLSRFRDFLRQQGHELLSTPAIITHFTPLWATTPLSRKERLASLSHATAHQRLAILSSFYRLVVQGRFDAPFTASPFPIHTAATSYRQAHPHQRGFDPQRATDALQQLSCSTPESSRDYALLWIGLLRTVFARPPLPHHR